MSKYVLSCCSTSDLSIEHLNSRNINYICFHFTLDGKQYDDDLGKSVPINMFYKALVNGSESKTSQINTDEYIKYFESFLSRGLDVIHVSLSSGISGSYNSAVIARNEIADKYPDRKIIIVDSLAASSGYGLFMDQLADLRDAGLTIDELNDWANNHKHEVHHWFFSTDLTFYVKGGRVSKASGWFGTILKICPLLNVDHNGKLIPREKIRTKAKVIPAIVERMEQFAHDGHEYDGKCFISHSACYEDAKAVAELVEERFPALKDKVKIFDIGTVIGSHSGPGTVALFFWGSKRED